jgi:hypothetical protein
VNGGNRHLQQLSCGALKVCSATITAESFALKPDGGALTSQSINSKSILAVYNEKHSALLDPRLLAESKKLFFRTHRQCAGITFEFNARRGDEISHVVSSSWSWKSGEKIVFRRHVSVILMIKFSSQLDVKCAAVVLLSLFRGTKNF